MTETTNKVPVKIEKTPTSAQARRPFRYYMRERSAGSFERTFQVPEAIDTDKIKASLKKGVLAVTLPTSAEARRAEGKIVVKASGSARKSKASR